MLGEDNIVSKALSFIGDLVILNIIFTLTCVPIITFGASFSSMLYVLLRKRNGRDEGVFKTYFRAFATNFIPATLYQMLIIFLSLIIWISRNALIMKYNYMLVNAIAIFLGLLIFILSLYFFASLVSFDLEIRQAHLHLANGIKLGLGNGLSSLLMAVLTFIVIYFSIVDRQLLMLYFFFWSFIGFSLLTYFYTYFIMKSFNKLGFFTEETATED